MYTVLVGLTCFVMFILAIGVFTPYDTTDHRHHSATDGISY